MIEIKAVVDGYKYKVQFKSWLFPGGENGFCLLDGKEYLRGCEWAEIIARIQSAQDLMEFMSAVYAIKEYENCQIQAFIPYWPGARQDRVANIGEALTTKIYADIINNLDLQYVQLVDPHSDVTPALVNNSWLYPIHIIIGQAIKDSGAEIIICPDAGAAKRISDNLKKLNLNIPIIQCLKKRDTITGRLSGFQVLAEPKQLDNKKCLIIDDICDGGGTFIGLVEELDYLINNFPGDIFLYVTHGVFSQGYDKLLENFKKIYTTDSFIPKLAPPERVKIYNLY